MDKLALEQERQAVQTALDGLRVMPVRDQETLTRLNAWLVEGKGRAKEIKALEDSVNKPLNEALKANRAIYKPVLDLYSALEQVLKAKVVEGSAYLAAEQSRILAEAATAYQTAETPEAQAAATSTLMSMPETPEHKGTSIRKVWRYEVIDLTQLPDQYVVREPNRAALNAAVLAGAREIPGVRIYEDQIVTTRTA